MVVEERLGRPLTMVARSGTSRWYRGSTRLRALRSPRRARAASSAAATRVGAVPPMTSHEASAPSSEAAARSCVADPRVRRRGRRPPGRRWRRAPGRPSRRGSRRGRRPRLRPGRRASRRCGGRHGTGYRAGPARRRRPWRSCSPRSPPRASAPRRRSSVSIRPAMTPSDAS